MKEKNSKAPVERKSNFICVIASVLIICIFVSALALSLDSRRNAFSGYKESVADLDALVSFGTPQSKLNLKRIFDGMKNTYTDVQGSVYEPVSAKYMAFLQEKKNRNENFSLSVEEVIYIISETAAAYDKYDVIRLRDENSNIALEIFPEEINQDFENPLHLSAYERICEISKIIEYRVKTLTSEEGHIALENGERGYLTRKVQSDNKKSSSDIFDTERKFVFSLNENTGKIQNAIVFESNLGKRTSLFPKESDIEPCKIKVVEENKKLPSIEDSELLMGMKIDPNQVRNITPEYWYSKTDVRIFIYGKKFILTDAENSVAFELLQMEEKLSCFALRFNEKQGEYEVLFGTYKDSAGEIKVYNSKSKELKSVFKAENIYPLPFESPENRNKIQIYGGHRVDKKGYILAYCADTQVLKTFED